MPSVIAAKALPNVAGPTRSLPASLRHNKRGGTSESGPSSPTRDTGRSSTSQPNAVPPPTFGSARNASAPPPSFSPLLSRIPSQPQEVPLITKGAEAPSGSRSKSTNALPLLTTQQTHVLTRNTAAILDLHVKFLTLLLEALERAGFVAQTCSSSPCDPTDDLFARGNETEYSLPRMNSDRMDDAVRATCHVFDEYVSLSCSTEPDYGLTGRALCNTRRPPLTFTLNFARGTWTHWIWHGS